MRREAVSFVIEREIDEQGRILRVSEYLLHPRSVGIIAFLDEKLIMVKQYRRGADRVTLEIPAGKVAQNESLEEAVRRELLEETGYWPNNVKFAFSFYPSPGMNTEQLYVYTASDLQKHPSTPDSDEDIEVILVSKTQISELLYKEIIDAKTLLALYYIGFI